MASLAPSRRKIGVRQKMPQAMISPLKMAVKKLTEAMRLAAATSFSPSCSEIRLPPPMPRVKPTAWMHAMSEKQIPTAPVASVPREDTVRLSTRLAAEVISILAMDGSASESRSREVGACIIRSCSDLACI